MKGVFYKNVPSSLMELILITVICIAGMRLAGRGNAELRNLFPLISVYALAFLRLSPILSRIVHSRGQLENYKFTIKKINKELAVKSKRVKATPTDSLIEINKVEMKEVQLK